MTEAVIRLDRSKAFSECRGERQPDDPHYHVHFWQGQDVTDPVTKKKAMVLLPFDSEDNLVPDDGRVDPYQGIVEGKPVMHQPLYSKAMRDLLERKMKRHAAITVKDEEPADDAADLDAEDARSNIIDEVNLASWLRGVAKYEWPVLQTVCKARYHKIYQGKKQMVIDLVLDERVVPESEVCSELARHLSQAA